MTHPPPAALLAAYRDQAATLGPLGALAGTYERLPALALHVALSILVFTAVRVGRRRLTVGLVAAAVALHAFVDGTTVVAGQLLGPTTLTSTWLVELVLTIAVGLVIAAVVLLVRRYGRFGPVSQVSGA